LKKLHIPLENHSEIDLKELVESQTYFNEPDANVTRVVYYTL
jgi:hypothetical protein